MGQCLSSIWKRNIVSHCFTELEPSLIPSCSFLQLTFPPLPFSPSSHIPSQVFTFFSSTHVFFPFTPFHWSLSSFHFLPPPVFASFQLISASSLPLTLSILFSPITWTLIILLRLFLSLSPISLLFLSSTSSKLNPPFSSTHLSFLSFPPSPSTMRERWETGWEERDMWGRRELGTNMLGWWWQKQYQLVEVLPPGPTQNKGEPWTMNYEVMKGQSCQSPTPTAQTQKTQRSLASKSMSYGANLSGVQSCLHHLLPVWF